MISVSLMKPMIYPTPENLVATVHYGSKHEWNIREWPCNVSLPSPPEHTLLINFAKSGQSILGVLRIPLNRLYEDNKLPMKVWVSLERETLSRAMPPDGAINLLAVINRADQIQSPKMYLVLTTVVGVDPSASAILKEGNELETNWMNQMQELHQSLEVVKNNSENSNVIYRRKVHLEIHQVLRKA